MAHMSDPGFPSRSLFWTVVRGLLLLSLVTAVVLTLITAAIIGAWIVYWTVVPAYSASTEIPELHTTLTLRFYFTEDENTDHGRYLSVAAPNGRIKIAMTGFDWAHNARTSVYLTPEHRIGIVGPFDDDYLLSLDQLKTEPARGPSEDWTYLGAFDFQQVEGIGRQLRFISAAEQGECIPMRGLSTEDYQVRKATRRRDCW